MPKGALKTDKIKEKRTNHNTWGKGPLICKVPLSPEQAVLACCSDIQVARDATAARFGTGNPSWCEWQTATGADGPNCDAPFGKANCTDFSHPFEQHVYDKDSTSS
ncbi:hypothetical protein OAA99_00275 [Omnitrophica bacterium]|nr:hypothetical protein [Candidatus Omnitrophota bacterium]